MMPSSVEFLEERCGRSLLSVADIGNGWWLPPNHSLHGAAIDSLFYWIVWITTIALVAVEITLIIFMIRFRHRAGKNARFMHGHPQLELGWTVILSLIFAVLALASKKVWDNYRYADAGKNANPAKVLVIGEQFKWNFIYPGPDGKFGRYLIYPKLTDERWQNPDGSGKPFQFRGTIGPADLPIDDAISAVRAYVMQINPLGKDFDDPIGRDDNWVKQAGTRDLILPKGRPIDVELTSKDVIHDFYLPNFRVKMDAVPGMRGHVFFTSNVSSTERERASRRNYSITELRTALVGSPNTNLVLVIDEKSPGANFFKPRQHAGYFRYVDKSGQTIATDGVAISSNLMDQLSDTGILQVTAFAPANWELVCSQFCGANHFLMRGVVRFLEPAEYDALKLDVPGN